MAIEYTTTVLTSVLGRGKVRMEDLNTALAAHGAHGYTLAAFVPDGDLRGQRDGHLLIFQRPVAS
ncbi:MAG: hypothetical protein ACRDQZ_24840 [Mycobacteriales bacterium]